MPKFKLNLKYYDQFWLSGISSSSIFRYPLIAYRCSSDFSIATSTALPHRDSLYCTPSRSQCSELTAAWCAFFPKPPVRTPSATDTENSKTGHLTYSVIFNLSDCEKDLIFVHKNIKTPSRPLHVITAHLLSPYTVTFYPLSLFSSPFTFVGAETSLVRQAFLLLQFIFSF